jgi:hypothetical protein
MTTLENWIFQACNALGLQADFDCVVELNSNHKVHAVAHIHNSGARKGMLVVRNYADVRPYAKKLIQAGYGFSILPEPRPEEVFDLDSFKEMFQEWGLLV